MNLSIGIVGLPNSGKSTLFNALLKRQVALVANYPFTTIEPNKGVVPVPDERLKKIAKIVGISNIVPAVVEFVDIAGLVKGASKGEGLGNKFLAEIREVALICHLVRFFKDQKVPHILGSVDSRRDIEIINSELVLADLETLERQIKPKGKVLTKDEEMFFLVVEKLKIELNKGKLAKDVNLTEKEKELIKPLFLLTDKPVIYVANIDESEIKNFNQEGFLPIAAKLEAELGDFPEEEQQELLKQYGLLESGLDRLIKLAYKTLGLISFFTATGKKEVRAWTIKEGTRAREAAGLIHSDFAKKFIKAEVISYEDFVKYGGFIKAREKGAVRFEGADYIIKDGEVIEFKIST